MSLRRTSVPASNEPPAIVNPGGRDFKLTLFEAPPLPVSLAHQIACWWQDRRIQIDPEAESARPMLDTRPWFRSLPEQVRALLTASKASPAFSSRPVDVPDIWQDYLPNPYSWANSLLVHALVLTAMLLPFALRPFIKPVPFPPHTFSTTRRWCSDFLTSSKRADLPHGGGGSGGPRAATPRRWRQLPHVLRTQFTPPAWLVPQTPAPADAGHAC